MSAEIVAATGLEARAVRRALPDARVVEGGIGLARLRTTHFSTAVLCGLGGGLRPGIATGTVVIASQIGGVDGSSRAVDAALRDALAEGARRLGFEPLVAPVLGSTHLVTGAERARWAERGYALADMESHVIQAQRVGVVRVILDTPERELSPQWLHPLRAILQPGLWGQLAWLARYGPLCARRAAEVVGASALADA